MDQTPQSPAQPSIDSEVRWGQIMHSALNKQRLQGRHTDLQFRCDNMCWDVHSCVIFASSVDAGKIERSIKVIDGSKVIQFPDYLTAAVDTLVHHLYGNRERVLRGGFADLHPAVFYITLAATAGGLGLQSVEVMAKQQVEAYLTERPGEGAASRQQIEVFECIFPEEEHSYLDFDGFEGEGAYYRTYMRAVFLDGIVGQYGDGLKTKGFQALPEGLRETAQKSGPFLMDLSKRLSARERS